jgi:hypothetical protein
MGSGEDVDLPRPRPAADGGGRKRTPSVLLKRAGKHQLLDLALESRRANPIEIAN